MLTKDKNHAGGERRAKWMKKGYKLVFMSFESV